MELGSFHFPDLGISGKLQLNELNLLIDIAILLLRTLLVAMAASVAKNYMRDNNVPLSRFGVLVAQLESIVASASQKSPEPLLCFDLLSDLISAIDEEAKVIILFSHSH